MIALELKLKKMMYLGNDFLQQVRERENERERDGREGKIRTEKCLLKLALRHLLVTCTINYFNGMVRGNSRSGS